MNNKDQPYGSRIEVLEGDITLQEVEAIVNAANAQLILGGGVAGAIRERGGPSIQEECDQIGGTHVGGAVKTGAGTLPSRFVIHAVGPRMGEGEEDAKLRNATLNSLRIAAEEKLKSIAFPAISTGIFGYPIERCAPLMINEVKQFLKTHEYPRKVIFCLWGRDNYRIFKNALNDILSETEGENKSAIE